MYSFINEPIDVPLIAEIANGFECNPVEKVAFIADDFMIVSGRLVELAELRRHH